MTYYDLRLVLIQVRERPPLWGAHFEEIGAPGRWKTEVRTATTQADAVLAATADCVEALKEKEVVPRVG